MQFHDAQKLTQNMEVSSSRNLKVPVYLMELISCLNFLGLLSGDTPTSCGPGSQ